MKTLVIIRHAKSSWEQGIKHDFDRPLNERGRKDAPKIGAFLRQKGIKPDHIYSSPANRALSTAHLIAHEVGFPIEKIIENLDFYNFDDHLQPIIALLQQSPDTAETVFIFGHNETFTYLANHFTKNQIDHLPTCGVVCIRFVTNTWQNFDEAPATTDFVVFPKKLGL